MKTQIQYAREGVITDAIKYVSVTENVDVNWLLDKLANGKVIIPCNINHKNLKPIGIGRGLKCKINTNIGTSKNSSSLEYECQKLDLALNLKTDSVMDLSTSFDLVQIRKAMLERCSVPFGTVPIYQLIEEVGDVENIKEDDIFNVIEEHARDGVDFVTVHCGVTKDITPLAKKRVTGIVSRGGSILAHWMKIKGKENPLYSNFDRLLEICLKYDLTLSLGDGLRPGSLADANDEAQFAELKVLGELCKKALANGVQVMIEGPGHVPFDKIKINMDMENEICNGAPFYVLGPIVTDIAPGYDHITSAIGATMAGYCGASFLCYVTPKEHLGLPSLEDVKNGVVAFKIAAHAVDIANGIKGARDIDDELSKARFNFDWEKKFKLSIDPETAKKMYEEQRDYTNKDHCSMCGEKYCSMKKSKEV